MSEKIERGKPASAYITEEKAKTNYHVQELDCCHNCRNSQTCHWEIASPLGLCDDYAKERRSS